MDQTAQSGYHVTIVARDIAGRGQTESSREYGQAAQDRALFVQQEVEAPFEDGCEAAMSGQVCPLVHIEQANRIVEQRRQFAQREGVDPGRDDLDRQRNPVELPADVRHDLRIAVRQDKTLQRRMSPLDKQRHR